MPEITPNITKPSDFCNIVDGKLVYNFHPGQTRALTSTKRFIIVVAGTRGGKTVTGPPWMHQEIRRCGPGDYLIVAPTFPLLFRGAEQEFMRLFHHHLEIGTRRSNPTRFIVERPDILFRGTKWEKTCFNTPTTVYFVHATDPNALEAVTALAAWSDEAGQDDFKLESQEALERRLSIHQSRNLITTTPYNLGWLYTKMVRPWEKADKNHPYIDVIQFRSIDNPAFPREEYERQKLVMPRWRWDMMYNAQFSVPAGLVYDCMKDIEENHRIKPFPIPTNWIRFCGLDFGGINTYGLFAAMSDCSVILPNGNEAPAGSFFFYREWYPKQHMSIKVHKEGLLHGEPYIDRCVGGAKSEGQWRTQFAEEGFFVGEPPISEVTAGIQRAYGAIASGQVYVFDNLDRFWEEIYTYRYESDPETGMPTMDGKIVDQNKYHAMDSMRYLAGILPIAQSGNFVAAGGGQQNEILSAEQARGTGRIVDVLPSRNTTSSLAMGGGLKNRSRLPMLPPELSAMQMFRGKGKWRR